MFLLIINNVIKFPNLNFMKRIMHNFMSGAARNFCDGKFLISSATRGSWDGKFLSASVTRRFWDGKFLSASATRRFWDGKFLSASDTRRHVTFLRWKVVIQRCYIPTFTCAVIAAYCYTYVYSTRRTQDRWHNSPWNRHMHGRNCTFQTKKELNLN